MNNRKLDVVKMRVQQIRAESPWMEDYEIEAIICTEFDLSSFNVSEVRTVTDSRFLDPNMQKTYSAIKADAIGKYGAYEAVNKGATQRRDTATRALYTITENADNSQNRAVIEKAALTISNNIKRESNHLGFTLLLSIFIEILISVLIIMFTVKTLGWSISEVYSFVVKPRNMAFLHAGMLLVAMAFPFVAYLLVHKLPIAEMVPFYKLRKGEMGPLVLTGLAMMMVDGCFVNYVSHPGSVRGANYSFDVVSFGSSAIDIILTFVCLGAIPALIESFVFNGVVLQVLRRRGGDGFALVVSSLMYAALTTNFVEMPGAFITSMWLGYMVIYSGSLIPAVIVRLIERMLFFAFTQFGFFAKDLDMVMYIDCFVSSMLILAGIAALSTLLKRFPEYFVLKRSDPVLTLGDKVKCAISRWSFVVLAVYSVIFSLIQLFDLNTIIDQVSKLNYGA